MGDYIRRTILVSGISTPQLANIQCNNCMDVFDDDDELAWMIPIGESDTETAQCCLNCKTDSYPMELR